MFSLLLIIFHLVHDNFEKFSTSQPLSFLAALVIKIQNYKYSIISGSDGFGLCYSRCHGSSRGFRLQSSCILLSDGIEGNDHCGVDWIGGRIFIYHHHLYCSCKTRAFNMAVADLEGIQELVSFIHFYLHSMHMEYGFIHF